MTEQILLEYPSIDSLLEALATCSGRSRQELQSELQEHLAIRLAFLLLGEVGGASNYEAIASRATSLLGERITSVVPSLARVLCSIEAASELGRGSLFDLPYPMRKSLLVSQGMRCAVCGFGFSPPDGERSEDDAAPTLDHMIPYRIGGDAMRNLWILCGLCNRTKEAALHVGEHGREWSNNFVYGARRRVVAFWAMMRDGRCVHPGCGLLPRQSRLFVQRRRLRGAWVPDNCLTVCADHRAEDAIFY